MIHPTQSTSRKDVCGRPLIALRLAPDAPFRATRPTRTGGDLERVFCSDHAFGQRWLVDGCDEPGARRAPVPHLAEAQHERARTVSRVL
jgi:hypothetical protein